MAIISNRTSTSKSLAITYSLTAFTKSWIFFGFTKSWGNPKSIDERVLTSTMAKVFSFWAIISISAFWNVINWDEVARRYSAAV